MSIIPYEPFRHLDQLRRELDRYFSTSLPSAFSHFDDNFGIPRIDVHETENEIVATCDIPGIEKKEDIYIDIDQNVLTISGTIQRHHEAKEENMHRQERFVGRFHRSITLPAEVEEDQIKATYKNGVLEVRVPKSKGQMRKRIDVEFH
jgi:HSP20 family protein